MFRLRAAVAVTLAVLSLRAQGSKRQTAELTQLADSIEDDLRKVNAFLKVNWAESMMARVADMSKSGSRLTALEQECSAAVGRRDSIEVIGVNVDETAKNGINLLAISTERASTCATQTDEDVAKDAFRRATEAAAVLKRFENDAHALGAIIARARERSLQLDGDLPGQIGVVLENMQQEVRRRNQLRSQIEELFQSAERKLQTVDASMTEVGKRLSESRDADARAAEHLASVSSALRSRFDAAVQRCRSVQAPAQAVTAIANRVTEFEEVLLAADGVQPNSLSRTIAQCSRKFACQGNSAEISQAGTLIEEGRLDEASDLIATLRCDVSVLHVRLSNARRMQNELLGHMEAARSSCSFSAATAFATRLLKAYPNHVVAARQLQILNDWRNRQDVVNQLLDQATRATSENAAQELLRKARDAAGTQPECLAALVRQQGDAITTKLRGLRSTP